MDISLQGFQALASATKADRDIVINRSLSSIRTKFFHSASSNVKSAMTNRSTMIAFRTMLRGAYGDFGNDAFEQLLGDRNKAGRSLRAGDVLSAIRLAESAWRSTSEALLQAGRSAMDTLFVNHPILRQVPAELHEALKNAAFQKLSEEPAFNSFEAFDALLEKLKQDPDVLTKMVTPILLDVVGHHPALVPEQPSAEGDKPSLVLRWYKTWTDSDSKALLLNPKDPNTQALLEKTFSDFIEANRTNPDPTLKALIADWDNGHDEGEWSFEDDFFTFGRKYAAQLPMGLAFSSDKLLEEALHEGNTKLAQAAKERLAMLLAPKTEDTSRLAQNLLSLQKAQAQAEAKAIQVRTHGILTEALTTSDRALKIAQDKVLDLPAESPQAEVEKAKKEAADADRAYTIARDGIRYNTRGDEALIEKLLQKIEDGKLSPSEALPKLDAFKAANDTYLAPIDSVRELLRPFEKTIPESERKEFRTLTLDSGKSTCEALLAKAKTLEAETRLAKARLEDAHKTISEAHDLPHKQDLLALINALLESKLPAANKAAREANDLVAKVEAFSKRLDTLSEDNELSTYALAEEIQKHHKDLEEAAAHVQKSVHSAQVSLEDLLGNPALTSSIKNVCFEDLRQAILESKDFPRFAPAE